MKILIIKLGALGDVLRTTPLLAALRAQDPSAQIAWLVNEEHQVVLRHNPLIAELLPYNESSLKRITTSRYDHVINLDKEPEALHAAQLAKAPKKSGFVRDEKGQLGPADELSDYAYRLGIDDELKFRLNQKTYQEICFEQVGLSFNQEEYLFSVQPLDRQVARAALSAQGFGMPRTAGPVVGLNTGSGWRFAGKKLSTDLYLSLIERLYEELDATVLLLGGEDEKERNKWLARNAKAPIINAGSHPIGVFAGMVEKCQLVITGDTTAMHIAIAVRTPVLVHFGATCASEIELYGRGRKLVSDMPCGPCYKKVCPLGEPCMASWTAEQICQQAKDVLANEAACIR